MKKLLLLPLTSLFIYSGSADAIIQCSSGSGRTILKFYDQDVQGEFNGGTLTIDKSTVNYQNNMSKKKNDSHMMVNFKKGIYTAYYKDANSILSFYALPKTIEKLERKGYEAFYKFNGIITEVSTDPRKNGKNTWHNALEKNIWVGCTLKYSI